jgi:hypothetical protein
MSRHKDNKAVQTVASVPTKTGLWSGSKALFDLNIANDFVNVILANISYDVGERTDLVEDWNEGERAKGAWAFRYRHSKSSFTFVLKALRLGSRLSVHAYIVEQDDVVVNLDLTVADYVDVKSELLTKIIAASKPQASESEDKSSSAATTSWMPMLKNMDRLHKEFKDKVMVKLMPTVEDLASQIRFSNAQQQSPAQSSQQQAPRRDPLRVYPPEGSRPSPNFGDFEDDFDPSFAGMPHPSGGMAHYGDSDLFGSYGRYGQVPGGYGNFGGFGGSTGGSSVGPHHPGFGPGVNDPYAIPRGGRGGPGGMGGLGAPDFVPPPRGARFDPFGPPIDPGSAPRPNPDHHAPPGFDHMYS